MSGVQASIGIRELLWAAGKALLIALVLTPIVRDIFRAYNVVDRPGIRKVHAYPIPRLGGISIAAAYVIGLAGLLEDRTIAWQLLPGAAVIFFTGILDDFFNLSARFKLLGQIAAACVAFASGLSVPVGPPALRLVLTVAWLLLTINAFNLVDGLDGLCGGLGLVAAGGAFAAALIHGNAMLEYAAIPLVGALLGFLFHNFSRATVFLGDSGALLVGFLAGCFGLMWSAQALGRIAMLAPVLALSLPLLDVALSVIRRFLQAQPIFSADRGHIHHRLLDRGFSPRKAVSLLYLWAAAGAGFALLLSYEPLRAWRWLAAGAYCVVTWACIRQLRYPEFNMAARLLFAGEFRRTVQARTRTQNLVMALQRARSEDDWWIALVGSGHESGWAGVVWLRNGSIHREKRFSNAPAGWTLSVVLNPQETIRVEGNAQTEFQPDLAVFAKAVKGSFAECSGLWEPSRRI